MMMLGTNIQSTADPLRKIQVEDLFRSLTMPQPEGQKISDLSNSLLLISITSAPKALLLPIFNNGLRTINA